MSTRCPLTEYKDDRHSSERKMSCHTAELEAVFSKPDLARRHTAPMVKADPFDQSENPKLIPGRQDSIFSAEIMPICWYSFNTHPFTCKDGKFTPVTGYEYIKSSYLEAKLPPLGVKPECGDEYHIAWCEYVGNEIVLDMTTKVDDYIDIQWFDHHWLNMHPDFFQEVGFDKEYHEGVGNTKELTEFASALPMHNIRVDQPHFYSDSIFNAFPLFLVNSQSTFSHNYNFLLEIDQLLRMRTLVGDKYVEIKPDLDKLVGVPNDGKLESPKLYGKFVKIRENEKKWNECERNEYTYFTSDIVACDQDNDEICGKTVPIDLKDSAPTVAIFVTAHNLTAQDEYNRRALYGTMDKGITPIYTNTLKIKGKDKFTKLGSHHLTGVNLKHHFSRAPRPVFLCHPFSDKPGTSNITVSTPLKDLDAKWSTDLVDIETIRWKCKNTDVRGKSAADKYKPNTEKFKIIIRLMCQHEMYISKTGIVSFKDG